MKNRKAILIVVAFILVGALSAYVLVDISRKKFEAQNPFFRVVEIGQLEDDPQVWGKNFPLQYDTYQRTVDQVRTQYGGSEAVPKMPTETDPRSVVAQSKLQEDPRLVTMWKGYAFAEDFREERGHAYMLSDQVYTKRQVVAPQPGTCLNCHASTYVAMMKLGDGDLYEGFHKLNAMTYKEGLSNVKHPVSCIDCHNPDTMELRVTRPAFMEGIKKVKAQQGVHNFQVNKDASRQEMRVFVCAQCHVEYYFKGKGKTLTFPWDKGIRGDDMLEYYKENPHVDWTHALTGGKMLKAQHPEFEMWSQGVHAKAGVSCVDCHMPYERVGAMKITNHHVRSPMLSINKSCQTCHHTSEEELFERVSTIQVRHHQMRDKAMDALMELIEQLKAVKDGKLKVSDAALAEANQLHREAQFLIDFVEAENSGGFHAPQEAARLMVIALDKIRKAQAKLY